MSRDNEIGVPKPGEQPTRDQVKELLLRVLEGMIKEKERHNRLEPENDFE
jgi:hypothetical protein